jgi:hypothetical protein
MASNSPAGIAIDNQILLRDEEGLLKDSFAEFFEREEPLVCGREVLLEQAWMRLEGIRSSHHHSRDGLAAGIWWCNGRRIKERPLRRLFRRHGLQARSARMHCFRCAVPVLRTMRLQFPRLWTARLHQRGEGIGGHGCGFALGAGALRRASIQAVTSDSSQATARAPRLNGRGNCPAVISR